MKYLFLCFCLILCFCSKQEEEQRYCCGLMPVISFFGGNSGGNRFSFNQQGGLDSVFVLNSKNWWIEDTNDRYWWAGYPDYYGIDTKECFLFKPAEKPDYCDNNYCSDDKNQIMKIECPWFSTVKKNDSTMLVSVKRNDTEERREIGINIWGYYVETGEYVTGSFWIEQCP